jgi:hypothetical protein
MPQFIRIGDGMIVIKWRSSREVPVDSQDLTSIYSEFTAQQGL